ncbi:hypothetical protein [Ralstonia pseudosolanacearum]|nr:hypothetical protein [Ralstonia pseudosolanacearum]
MQHLPETTVLTFENVEFDVIDLRNVPWLGMVFRTHSVELSHRSEADA